MLAERTILGYHAKVIFVFSNPWWREAGLSGVMESTSATCPIAFTRDTCSEQDEHYSITCFLVGESGRRWSALSAADRRIQVLGHFTEVFGSIVVKDSIPQPISIIERQWTEDQWTLGGPVPVMPPELLDSEAGKAIGKPFGNVHFVGTETADVWRGYMEGAVRSGIRGAREVVECLKQGGEADIDSRFRAML